MTTASSNSATPLRAMLQISLAHEYYGGAFAQFTTTPLPRTALACRQLGLRVLQDGADLTLFVRCVPSQSATVAALRTALARTTLCWELTPLPPNFAAITDVAFAGSQERIVLTSETFASAGGRLTHAEFVAADDVWTWQPLAFDYTPPSPLPAGAELDVATAAGAIVSRLAVTDPTLVHVDVTATGSGLYQLLRGKRVLARWFADERGSVAAGAKPASMLVLDPDMLVAAFNHALEGSMPVAPPVYTAAYPARDITWRYHIFNARSPDALQIAALDESALADAASPRIGAPATKRSRRTASAAATPFFPISAPEYPRAASFEARAPFKLVQRPPQRFALLSAGQPIFSPLPVASPGFATRGQSAGFCSDIFVYL